MSAGDSLLRAVGKTPLVDLGFLGELPKGVALLAKLESCNPGGSLKDRPVARMLAGALRAGHLSGGRRVLDSSSGNAGISYAAFGAALGVPVTLVIPGNASAERLARIRATGAELVLTDPVEGYDFAIHEARRLANEQPERYWYCNQYDNDDNWRAHFETTGPEILAQVRERGLDVPNAFVAGVGTGGSLTGIARRLKIANSHLRAVCVVPDTFPGIEGLKPLGASGDLVPGILDSSLVAERIELRIEDALAMCRRLARAGIFAGPSSGAYVEAALRIARRGDHRIVITLICDTGERYFSTGMWSA
jgi:cysteine synthase B